MMQAGERILIVKQLMDYTECADAISLDVVDGSQVLAGILPWPWEANATTDTNTGEVTWDVLQSRCLHNGERLYSGDRKLLLEANVGLKEAEAKLVAKAPEMYVLLRRLLAGQNIRSQAGLLVNAMEFSMERGKHSMRKFTVLMLRPAHISYGFSPDTYLAQVEADSSVKAILSAQREVAESDDLDVSPTDYIPLITMDGWHDDITPDKYKDTQV